MHSYVHHKRLHFQSLQLLHFNTPRRIRLELSCFHLRPPQDVRIPFQHVVKVVLTLIYVCITLPIQRSDNGMINVVCNQRLLGLVLPLDNTTFIYLDSFVRH